MIEENKINFQQSLDYIDAFPNPLTLSRESESDYYSATMTLTNKTNNYVIFKVYFSQLTLFCASPSIYFIQPLSAFNITVKSFEKRFEKSYVPIKMLIAVHQMEKVIDSKEEVKEIFDQKKEDKTPRQEIYVLIKVSNDQFAFNTHNNNSNESIGNEDINCEDLPIALGIEKMQNINSNYKAIIDSKQKSISILESQLENLGRNKLLFKSKEKALTKTETVDQGKTKSSLSQTKLLMLLLISLVIGGFFAKVVNGFFSK